MNEDDIKPYITQMTKKEFMHKMKEGNKDLITKLMNNEIIISDLDFKFKSEKERKIEKITKKLEDF